MFTIFKTMLLGIARDAHTLFWTILFPVAMLCGLGLYFDGSGYAERLLAGVLAMNVLFGATMVTAFNVMAQRNRGVYKLLRATPFSTAAFIAAMTGARTVLALVVSVCIIVTAALLFGVSLSLAGLAGILLALFLGSICFTAIGFFAANLSRDESNVNMISNLISFPMLFASEAFYSLQNAPVWVKTAAQVQPFHYFVKALNLAVTGGRFSGELWTALAMLTGFAALFLAAAAFTFRWDTEGTSRGRALYRTSQRHSPM